MYTRRCTEYKHLKNTSNKPIYGFETRYRRTKLLIRPGKGRTFVRSRFFRTIKINLAFTSTIEEAQVKKQMSCKRCETHEWPTSNSVLIFICSMPPSWRQDSCQPSNVEPSKEVRERCVPSRSALSRVKENNHGALNSSRLAPHRSTTSSADVEPIVS